MVAVEPRLMAACQQLTHLIQRQFASQYASAICSFRTRCRPALHDYFSSNEMECVSQFGQAAVHNTMRSHRLSQRIDLDLAKLVSTTAYRLFPPQIVLQELPLKRAVLFSRVLKELGSLVHCRLNVLLTPSARLHLWANARLVSHALRLGRIALERYVLKHGLLATQRRP